MHSKKCTFKTHGDPSAGEKRWRGTGWRGHPNNKKHREKEKKKYEEEISNISNFRSNDSECSSTDERICGRSSDKC